MLRNSMALSPGSLLQKESHRKKDAIGMMLSKMIDLLDNLSHRNVKKKTTKQIKNTQVRCAKMLLLILKNDKLYKVVSNFYFSNYLKEQRFCTTKFRNKICR